MNIEMELRFRSSFNLIPEGNYTVPADLRRALQQNGFEIGVHDLEHDGKLYYNREDFRKKAERINAYLKDWGAVGFRSAFMLHNLEWLADLDISYDASTFDTDPFEPQPDGVNSIFPFWVSRDRSAQNGSDHAGYVELPYTLVQDSTLFLHLKEPDTSVWKMKLDWIASHGGMALLDTHPDYMSFSGEKSSGTYPAEFYREFLHYVRQNYGDKMWAVLPRTMAEWYRPKIQPSERPASAINLIGNVSNKSA